MRHLWLTGFTLRAQKLKLVYCAFCAVLNDSVLVPTPVPHLIFDKHLLPSSWFQPAQAELFGYRTWIVANILLTISFCSPVHVGEEFCCGRLMISLTVSIVSLLSRFVDVLPTADHAGLDDFVDVISSVPEPFEFFCQLGNC